MHLLTRLSPLLALAACALAGRGSGSQSSATLQRLPAVARVRIRDVASGAGFGEVQRADSVAALTQLYTRLSSGWTKGAAHSPEISATFYDGSGPVAVLTLASGAFETRVNGRVLHRPASPDEALSFVLLAGVIIRHGPNDDASLPRFDPRPPEGMRTRLMISATDH